MSTALTDRFRFLARSGQRDKTPILAEVPEVKTDGTVATLRLYDPIDSWGEFWGVSAKEFVAALDELPEDTTEIRLHINSPGGEVFEGIAILNALRAHKAKVVTIVDGLAASAASFIAMAGDEVVMARNSELMIHDAWGICVGNDADMHKTADELDHFSDNLADIYAAKAGGDVATWRAAMSAETWYSADEAVAAGLADRVDAAKADDQAKNRFDLTVFAHAGRTQAPAPQTPATTSVSGSTENPEESMSLTDAQVADLRTRLGITDENADGDTILAALDEALSEQTPAQPTLPDGTVAVDAAQLTELRAQAQMGREAREQQLAEHRERLVAAAVSDGRIPPARKDHWLAQLAADPGAESALGSLAPGLVPLAEVGYGAAPEATVDDALYASVFGDDAKVGG